MVRSRQEIIEGALDRGYSKDVINKGLQLRGDKPLTDYETMLIDKDRYGMNPLERFAQGAIEFGKGLGSGYGAYYQYVTNPNFKHYINKNVGNYIKGVVTGRENPVVDTLNLMLSPSTLTVNKVLTQSPAKTLKTIANYAGADPFNFALDVAPIYGGVTKAFPAVKASNLLEKATSKVPLVDKWRSALMPSDREKAINSILNFGDAETFSKGVKVGKEIDELSLRPDIAQAVRDLTVGTNLGGQTTQDLANLAKKFNKEMVDLGVDIGQAKKTATSQYILEQLDPNRTKNIYVQHIEDAMANPTAENLKRLGIKEASTLTDMVEDASKLFDEGRIFPITQRGTFLSGDKNLVDLADIGKGIDIERVYGLGTPEQVASRLDIGYGKLLREIQDAKMAQNNLSEMASKYGRGISPDEIAKIGKNEVIISPTEFKEGIRTLFKNNKQSELGTLTRQLEKGISPNSLKKYSNDLYVLNKKDLRMLANKYGGINTNSAMGRLLSATKPIIGGFKSAVLAKFPYFVGNRIGNWSLGLIGGADYVTALKPEMVARYIPDYLKYSTSFHGIAPQFTSSSLPNTFKNISRNLARNVEELRSGKLDTIQTIEKGLDTAVEAQAYATRPLFQLESSAELIDRSAVYFKSARDYAKETGQEFTKVLDKALSDNNLQRELIDRVNNVLGDYVGRNYYINPTAYELGATAFPFHKVITTSKDVLINQAQNNPLRMQAFARIPSRVGNNLAELDRTLGNQPMDNDVRGGMVMKPSYSTFYPALKVYNDYNPLIAPIETMAGIINPKPNQYGQTGVAGAFDMISGNLNPITGLFNALQGEDRFGNLAVAPNVMRVGNKYIAMDNNGNRLEQPKPNVAGTFANYIASNYFPAVTFANQTILPAIGALTNREYFAPTSRAIFGQFEGQQPIPILSEGNTNRLGIKTPEDFYRSQLGFRTREVYRERPQYATTQDLLQGARKRGRQIIQYRNRRYGI